MEEPNTAFSFHPIKAIKDIADDIGEAPDALKEHLRKLGIHLQIKMYEEQIAFLQARIDSLRLEV